MQLRARSDRKKLTYAFRKRESSALNAVLAYRVITSSGAFGYIADELEKLCVIMLDKLENEMATQRYKKKCIQSTNKYRASLRQETGMQKSAIEKDLLEMKDEKYAAFNRKLAPNIDPESVIGVRVPLLRAYAKKIKDTPEAEKFLKSVPHRYQEENQLHMFLVSEKKDVKDVLEGIDAFLPYVNNWAVCDIYGSKVLKKHPEETLLFIKKWLAEAENMSLATSQNADKSEAVKASKPASKPTDVSSVDTSKTYIVRYAVGLLMSDYLDDNFEPWMPQTVAAISSDEYYINMMCAWYMATALAKQKETVLPYFTECRMNAVVWKMAVRKSIESFRIDDDLKAKLREIQYTE